MKPNELSQPPKDERITIRLEAELLAKIDRAARGEKRKRSQWLVVKIGEILEKADQK